MSTRSLASLTLSFGLVNVPVKLYSATEASASVHFHFLAKDGSHVKQQYVSEKTGKVVERADMVKGYEYEKNRYAIFTAEELKALDESASQVIEIVAFVPEQSVDPIYYDRAYYLAPDKRGDKPYALLIEALRKSGRCALARWVWKGKQYVVQVRAAKDGLVLQQLLYADEVSSQKDLGIKQISVADAELRLALKLIDQISQDGYDPSEFKDAEKQRVLRAIDEKVAGKELVASAESPPRESAQVIDLMEALRASLKGKAGASAADAGTEPSKVAGAPKVAAGKTKSGGSSKKASGPAKGAAVPTRGTKAVKAKASA